MKIIDLSLSVHPGMFVYSGDPEVDVEQVQTLERDGWNMKRLHINGHDGTHVNVPIHCKAGGKTLDDYVVEDFCGECVLYESQEDITADTGVLFREQITLELAKRIREIRPSFVGLSAEFEFDIVIEKFLLQNDILCFERLTNTDQLPKKFFFHGVPLKIKEGDGSPIRAYAIY